MSTTKYRIYFNPAIEKKIPEFKEEFSTLAQAEAVLNAIANFTLYLHEKQLMLDYSNFGGIEKFVIDEWINVNDLTETELSNKQL